MMDEFTTAEIQTDKTSIFVRSCGSGPPVLLLHGFPQTHLMWHGVAPLLARHFAVVCADLRGYRRSSCPASAPNHAPYAKRSMARDLVSMMQQLGFERFSVAGHDRGGRVAYRMAPDHPDRVDRLAVLDILPTETVWERAEEGGPIALWRAWCDEVQGLALDAGHFFPEEAPEQTADALNLKNRQTFALFTTLL